MIHPTALVDPEAVLGENVTVGPFAYIEGDVTIGDGCAIGPRATILRYTSLGPGCKVHTGAILGDLPQDVGFKEMESHVEIGANCAIREGVTVHRASKEGQATRVGDGCFLMAFSHCAHDVKVGNRVIVCNGALLAGHVEVDDGAFISGNVSVHQFVKIGRLAMLAGNCAVSKDVPPFVTVRPVSLNGVAGLNVIGMRRAGFTAEQRKQVRDAYKTLYHAGLPLEEALKQLRDTYTDGPVLEIGRFAERSTRGLCPWGGSA